MTGKINIEVFFPSLIASRIQYLSTCLQFNLGAEDKFIIARVIRKNPNWTDEKIANEVCRLKKEIVDEEYKLKTSSLKNLVLKRNGYK